MADQVQGSEGQLFEEWLADVEAAARDLGYRGDVFAYRERFRPLYPHTTPAEVARQMRACMFPPENTASADDPQDRSFRPNPARYERLSRPLPSWDAANEAVRRFHAGVEKLREECGLPDVVAVCAGTHLDREGEEVTFALPLQFGDRLKAEGLAAYLYGKMQSERQEVVARMMRDGLRQRA